MANVCTNVGSIQLVKIFEKRNDATFATHEKNMKLLPQIKFIREDKPEEPNTPTESMMHSNSASSMETMRKVKESIKSDSQAKLTKSPQREKEEVKSEGMVSSDSNTIIPPQPVTLNILADRFFDPPTLP